MKSTPTHNTRGRTHSKKLTTGSTTIKKKTIPKPFTKQKDHTAGINGTTQKKDNIPA